MCPVHQLSKNFIHSLLLTNITSDRGHRSSTSTSNGTNDVRTIEDSDDEGVVSDEIRNKITNRRNKSNLSKDLTKTSSVSELLTVDNRLRKIAHNKIKFSL